MDLQTTYLGLTLKNPLIVSSCKLSDHIENIIKMEQAGAAAIVMPSIFEEEIRYDDDFADYFKSFGADSFAESLNYFPDVGQHQSVLDQHLNHLTEAVRSVRIPIIGSLNAISPEGWIDYAVKMQETGISALELNLYQLPIEPESAEKIEQRYIDIVKMLKQQIKIPLAVKLSPFFTSVADMVMRLDREAHVDGMVLFNRFYAPNFDVNSLEFTPDMQLSTSYESHLPQRWIAILSGQMKASIAGSTGVHTSDDLVRYLLVGANAITCASCLMQNGIDYLKNLLSGLQGWMQKNKYDSIESMRGLMSQKKVANPAEFERAQYMKVLRGFMD